MCFVPSLRRLQQLASAARSLQDLRHPPVPRAVAQHHKPHLRRQQRRRRARRSLPRVRELSFSLCFSRRACCPSFLASRSSVRPPPRRRVNSTFRRSHHSRCAPAPTWHRHSRRGLAPPISIAAPPKCHPRPRRGDSCSALAALSPCYS